MIRDVVSIVILLPLVTFGIQRVVWYALEESIAAGDLGVPLTTFKEVVYSVVLSPMIVLHRPVFQGAESFGLDSSQMFVVLSWMTAGVWAVVFGLMALAGDLVLRRSSRASRLRG